MAWPEPVTLRGDTATLVPLSAAHHDDLVIATRDGELWKLWYTFVPSPETMSAEIKRRLSLQDKGSRENTKTRSRTVHCKQETNSTRHHQHSRGLSIHLVRCLIAT